MQHLDDPSEFLALDPTRQHSPSGATQKIDDATVESVLRTAADGKEAIERRLEVLAREWDIDRVLILNFGALVFAQLLAARRDRRWLWGPLIQTPLLMMHAIAGWCPPVLWFRPMGFRTRFEIQAEREALLRKLDALSA